MNALEAVAPDGSPVEVYLHIPPGHEPDLIRTAVPKGATILELGCGAGRITRPLVALGYRVTAVDNSAEMLAHVEGAETVLADIEGLDLGRRFKAVILGSHLINESGAANRRAFLETCRKHVEQEGMVLIERYDPNVDWREHENTSSELGDVVCTLRDVRVKGRGVQAIMEYKIGARTWRQPFTAELLTDKAIETELAGCNLRHEGWLDDRGTWLLARPLSG
ncbi:MAG: class I SAM-dependent methyltransferase [Actinomycetota bacterium]